MKGCPEPRAQGTARGNARDSSGYYDGRHGRQYRANHERGRGGRGGRGSNQAEAVGDSSATVYPTAPAGRGFGASGSSLSGCAVNVGGANTSMRSAGANSSQRIGRARSVSGAFPTAEAAATARSVYSSTWSGWTRIAISSMSSAEAQPPWRQERTRVLQQMCCLSIEAHNVHAPTIRCLVM